MIVKKAPDNLVRSVFAFCPILEDATDKFIVAGGFIRAYFAGENPSDLDLYFRNEVNAQAVESLLAGDGWQKAFETDRAVSMVSNNRMVQLIKVIYGVPAMVIDVFDFTVCSIALTIKAEQKTVEQEQSINPKDLKEPEPEYSYTGEVTMDDDFMEHLAGRILEFKGSSFPLSSLKRAIKYIKKGYNICDENIIKLAEAIARDIDFDDPVDLEEHIDGLDPDARGIRAID